MDARSRMVASLNGLAVGDGFGQRFFTVAMADVKSRKLPPTPWPWTDDTHMALSIVEVLTSHGGIDPDALAAAFARRFVADPGRGYARGAATLLTRLAHGADWRVEAPALFDGGSYGNGGAMRAAPIGAYFAGDPTRAGEEARKSALVTHAHPEGQAGAMAVAMAASLAEEQLGSGAGFIDEVVARLPASQTRDRMAISMVIPADDLARAYPSLGTGLAVAAFDTVPLCVWMAAHHGSDFADAMWKTVAGMGDRDTTCAIVGGIIAAGAVAPPAEWVAATEPLPAIS